MTRNSKLNTIFPVLILFIISLAVIGGCNNNNSNNNDDRVGAPVPGPGDSSGDRTVTIINKCSQTIWIGVVGANPEDQVTNCPTNPCPSGQACNTRSSPSQCEWALPAPDSGTFQLAPSGQMGDQAVFTIPASQAVGSGGQMLNANIYGQTGCSMTPVSDCSTGPCGESCTSAPCNAPSRDKPCDPGAGPEGAHTQAELNLFNTIVDSYDVSYINGLNVPMEINPTNGTLDSSNPYVCGNPGATTAVSNLLDCTYSYDTKITINSMTTDYAPYLRYVTNGGDACTFSDPTCTMKDEVCGLSMSEDFTTLSLSCGTQIGWWNADALCSTLPSFNDGPFDCQASAGADTFQNLYGCAGAYGSDCYNPNASSDNNCCGCPIWMDVPLPTCAAGTTSCCYNRMNTTWLDQAQPWAKFMKDACSTAYSFPDDDASSSFSCPQTNPVSPAVNTTDYEVIFCPGGESGF